MKKHLYLIFLLGLFIFSSLDLKSQEYYVVTGNTLNVREGAGANFNTISKLAKGDEIMVSEINGEWAKVHIADQDGYVNKNYLQLKSSIPTTSSSLQPKKSSIFENIGFWVACLTGLFLWITYIRYNKKCRNCGSWNAMRKTSTEQVGEKQSTIKKTETITDSRGNKHNNNYHVPATIYCYHVHRKCKICNHTDYIEKSDKVEN